jgi:hypothetical protein
MGARGSAEDVGDAAGVDAFRELRRDELAMLGGMRPQYLCVLDRDSMAIHHRRVVDALVGYCVD